MIPTETAESLGDTRCQLKASPDICIEREREIWSGVHGALMLSPRMVARIAFPLGYTCQSGAKLGVGRLDPREVPNVCLGVCISRAVSCVTWDKGG